MERNITITISGPAGSGKSTLLTLIRSALIREGVGLDKIVIRNVHLVRLDDMSSLMESPVQEEIQISSDDAYIRMGKVMPVIKDELKITLQSLTTRDYPKIPAS